MKKYIISKKYTIIFLSILFMLITWCGLQTFVINDDLPYSLFYRGSERISSLKQIYLNQRSDYLTINGRFFVHCVVQFVLMFEKKLFSIINAICIVLTIIFSKKIVDFNIKESKIKPIFIYFTISSLFLMLFSYKFLIYWVAGSVNYIWVFTLIIIFIYYYLKYGLIQHKVLNIVLICCLSIIHECSFVFVLFLILFDFITNIIKNKFTNFKKNITIYVIYIILCIICGLFVIKAPGNAARMSTSATWYNKSLLERIKISIPVVSTNLYALFNKYNLVPTIFLLFLLLYNFKKSNKFNLTFAFITSVFALTSYFTNNGWLYFILSILVIVNIIIDNFINNRNVMSVIFLSIYAVVFSMIITPEYSASRPNYYIYIWMIINIIIYLNYIFESKNKIKIYNIFSAISIIILCCIEYNIYYNIGIIKNQRLREIDNVKKNDLKVLRYKKIEEKYAQFHPDANCPGNSNYWAYQYFLNYYKLPNDLEIELVE